MIVAPKHSSKFAVLAATALQACGGSHKPPPAGAEKPAKDQKQEAGVVQKADKRIGEAHEDFKEGVKPVAKKVDETSRKVVDEAKKAVGADRRDDQEHEDDPRRKKARLPASRGSSGMLNERRRSRRRCKPTGRCGRRWTGVG
jgi:hypothetical protein